MRIAQKVLLMRHFVFVFVSLTLSLCSDYRIYRDTGSGLSTLATQAGATYSDSSVAGGGSGILHLYRVAARNAAFTTEFGAQTASLTAFDGILCCSEGHRERERERGFRITHGCLSLSLSVCVCVCVDG